MKKALLTLLTGALALSLAGCGGTTSAPGSSSSPQPSAPASQVPTSQADTSTTSGVGKTLVAYFSWSGNTRQMAEAIAQETGGDLFEISTATPYPDDYNTLLEIAQQEQSDGARPELAAQVEDWDSYDTIFVGYPNWWSDAPMAVYTFLEAYDFTGKTLIPFNTSASGGFGRSLTGIASCASGATILDGLALTQDQLDQTQEQVSTWLDGLGLDA